MNTKMTPREIVTAAIEFTGPERLPRDFPEPFGSDFAGMGMRPSPDMRPPGGKGTDEHIQGQVQYRSKVIKIWHIILIVIDFNFVIYFYPITSTGTS